MVARPPGSCSIGRSREASGAKARLAFIDEGAGGLLMVISSRKAHQELRVLIERGQKIRIQEV
jgi:hypothetical protein